MPKYQSHTEQASLEPDIEGYDVHLCSSLERMAEVLTDTEYLRVKMEHVTG